MGRRVWCFVHVFVFVADSYSSAKVDCRGDTMAHAPDRAAQGTGEGGNSDYQDLGLGVDADDPTDT